MQYITPYASGDLRDEASRDPVCLLASLADSQYGFAHPGNNAVGRIYRVGKFRAERRGRYRGSRSSKLNGYDFVDNRNVVLRNEWSGTGKSV